MNFLFFPIESESEDPDFVFTAGPEEHQEEPDMKTRSSGLKFTVISIGVNNNNNNFITSIAQKSMHI